MAVLEERLEVLILVLMEYGLRVNMIEEGKSRQESLNPCFNGIWSASTITMVVLCMPRPRLNPCFNGIWSASQ